MLGDDIFRLYKYLGQSSQNYLDFHTEEGFHKRIDRILRHRSRAASAKESARAKLPPRRSKIISVISFGNLPGRKLVASLAWAATQRLKGKIPVRVVDLIPVEDQHDEKQFLKSNNVTHVLIDTSQQAVRMESIKEVAWLGRQITSDDEPGLIYVDVPERVMHVRHHAMATSDMVIVFLPAAIGVLRSIEEIEAELGETLSSSIEGGVHYLLAESADHEKLSQHLLDDMIAYSELFVPDIMSVESMPSTRELSDGLKQDSAGLRDLLKIHHFIFGKISRENR